MVVVDQSMYTEIIIKLHAFWGVIEEIKIYWNYDMHHF